MRTLLIAAGLLACTGCIPVSLHTIASEAHFEQRYIGVWGEGGGYWEIVAGTISGSHPDPAGGNEYIMEHSDYEVYYTESGKTSELTARLTRIDGVDFLDLSPQHGKNSLWGNHDIGGKFLEELLTLPLHTWVKVDVVEGKLRMLPVDLDYINGVLEQDPNALPHISTGDEDWPIITASPDQLRAFIAKHMHNAGFFGEMADLTKLGNSQSRHKRSEIQSGSSNYDSQYRSQTAATQQNHEEAEKQK
jgi:hypothetical protein